MMSFGRIWALCLRYYYFFAKPDSTADLFFWPALDIFLWGMTSVWLQQSETAGTAKLAISILTGLVFWQIIWRSNYEIALNLLQEFWNRNLVNLFSTPLKLVEWIFAMMIYSMFKVFVSIIFGALVVGVLYELNIFTMGWAFLPFCVSLTISGWFIGFLSAAIVIFYGQRLQIFAWMTAYIFAPFSAIFYPVAALPKWGQVIAYLLPMSYTFEGMRLVLQEHVFSNRLFFIGLAWNIIYFIVALILFACMFEKSRKKGLARLE